MSPEEMQMEIDTQRWDNHIQHTTLCGRFQQLHEAMEEFISAVRGSLPSILR